MHPSDEVQDEISAVFIFQFPEYTSTYIIYVYHNSIAIFFKERVQKQLVHTTA